MPLHLPGWLDRLLSLLAPSFSQPTFQTFRAVVAGFIARLGEHTITGMWQAVRHAGGCIIRGGTTSRPPSLGSRSAWAGAAGLPDGVGQTRRAAVVGDRRHPVRPGRAKGVGAHYLHDGSQPAGQGKRTRWGNCFVVVGLVIGLPCLGGRSVCLPVLFRLFRPRDDQHRDRRTQPELAREMLELILPRFPRRVVHVLFDGA
jgi:hypothetical protein